ncbi:hypothetical protein [Pseudobacteriovorax antillogorgiicola]|uniref:Uncharacterized protein n=1 Tax=Pseudobacteriovorax antillogorgiicola TaxID=1513793 RepID=A0A1Y6CFZ0_9BACT|nr:hypothetical protein [Pseudobacteriovorax antillogorgiicola]TCS47649.1 hypothetical protein EDD56_12090 [Pseudobacteriovorax antillogorgiicola]SMF59843.1 hypothetical protein SAMN06296036_12050 [Pseudobacteriovorax antillogorgiicola]
MTRLLTIALLCLPAFSYGGNEHSSGGLMLAYPEYNVTLELDQPDFREALRESILQETVTINEEVLTVDSVSISDQVIKARQGDQALLIRTKLND